jgi:hypothetical protein
MSLRLIAHKLETSWQDQKETDNVLFSTIADSSERIRLQYLVKKPFQDTSEVEQKI